jgi:hypothetical protein
MVFSPPPDYLWQTYHPVTGVVTTWTRMTDVDLSFGRTSASYSVFSGNGGINPFGQGAAPLKIRTFKFTFNHPYQPGETYTSQRDALVQACLHGREMVFSVRCGDGTIRFGRGNCNVSDMHETRDAMVMFVATIEFECVNPFLTAQYETGTLRWDTGLVWDVGHGIFDVTASAPLTAGTWRVVSGANTSTAIPYNAVAEDVNAALRAATPAAIPLIATGGPPKGAGSPLAGAAPVPVRLSAISPGVIAAPTVTTSGLTGGTLAVTTYQAGSAATPQIWDFLPNRVALTTGSGTWTIIAGGNASDHETVITVDGPTNSYYLYNLSIPGGLNGYMGFGLLSALNAGEQHIIDVGRARVRKVTGAQTLSAWANFYLPPGQEDWFRIDPGANVISYQQVAPVQVGGHVHIYTKEHYL